MRAGSIVPSRQQLLTWMARRKFKAPAAAKFLKVNPRTVQRWLSGDRRIPDWLENVIG